MPETVFWDASAFVALGNADDDLHEQAVQASDTLARQKARILTTSAVLTEVANTFSRSDWRPVAHQLVESVRQSVVMGVAKVIHVDEALWDRGWALFVERPDKHWGLTDCISFVVMQDQCITRAFSSDRHFEQAGFERLMQP
jgi:predicted nucleic acid-binding protein